MRFVTKKKFISSLVIYEGQQATTQARSLWRLELVRNKWHGALMGWEHAFRIRHMTSGRYMGVASDMQVSVFVVPFHKPSQLNYKPSASLFSC